MCFNFSNLTLADDRTKDCYIANLHPELLAMIFKQVPQVEQIRLVNKQWNMLAETELFLRLCENQKNEIQYLLTHETAFLAKYGKHEIIKSNFSALKNSLTRADLKTEFLVRERCLDLISSKIILKQKDSPPETSVIFKTFDCSSCFLTRLPDAAIRESLFFFKNLSIINLSNNFLKHLPSNFIKCINLMFLDVSNNNLLSLPENLGQIKTLKQIKANNNQLQTIPKSLIGSLNLTDLQIQRNFIHSLPEGISEKMLGGKTLVNVLNSQKPFPVEDDHFRSHQQPHI